MKKALLSIAAVATLAAAAAPALAAQPYGFDRSYDHANWRGGAGEIDQRLETIRARIDQGQRDGSLSWREARNLRGQLQSVQWTANRYQQGGLTGWERQDLNAKLDRLSFQVRGDRHDFNDGPGYRR